MNKPKILLLNPPGKRLYVRDYFCSKVSKADYINAPIDLVMLSGVLNTGEFEIKLLDAIVEKLGVNETLKKIKEISPKHIVALIGSVSLWEDEEFLKELPLYSNAEIFVIGDFLLTEGVKFLRENKSIKGVILDFTSRGIYNYLKNEEEKITDLIINREDKIKIYPKSAEKEFTINLPVHEEFLRMNYRMPFVRHYPFATTITNYACPFQCSFCVMNTFSYKERTPENIFQELDYLSKLGAREIFFLDQTIGVNRKKLIDFLNEMIKRKYRFGWFGFTRVDRVDQEILKLMKEAGCHTLLFGVESGSGEILKKYRKGYTKEQIKNAFHLAKKEGIKTLATFIVGLPEETREMIEETIKFSRELDPDFVSFNFAVPRFGTELREKAIKENLVSESVKIMDQSGAEITMGTVSITREEMRQLKRKAVWGFYLRPKYILKRLVSLTSFTELKLNVNNFIALIKNEL